MIALGIDVGGTRKGFHAVTLAGDRSLRHPPGRIRRAEDLETLIRETNPTVVAIDAPCGWSRAKSRLAERALAQAGVSSFCTPSHERAAQTMGFYGWMFNGEAAFAAAINARPLYRGEASFEGRTMEVFPNATAFALSGERQPKTISKVNWRRAVLDAQGVDQSRLVNVDFVDAALCALTGLLALEGNFQGFGEPGEGILVAPRF
jgi:predicted nuclease with RNAse H fold